MLSATVAKTADARFIDIHPSSPLCPPDWRWRLAYKLSQRPDASRMVKQLLKDDVYLNSIVKFIQFNEKSSTEDAQYETLIRWPNLAQAHNLHFHPQAFISSSIQAWLIAGESANNIAKRLGADSKVIGWYERAFYDVRDRLEHQDYVIHILLGNKHHHGLNERDFDLFWKFIAYIGGPVVLEAVQRKSFQTIRPRRVEDLGQFVKDATKSMIELKALLTARVLTLSPLTMMPLLEIWRDIVKQDAASGAGDGSSSILKIVGEVISGLPYSAGRTAIDYSESTMPKIGGKSVNLLSAELRASELGQLSVTGKVPEGFSDLEFPLTSGGKKDESHLFNARKDDD